MRPVVVIAAFAVVASALQRAHPPLRPGALRTSLSPARTDPECTTIDVGSGAGITLETGLVGRQADAAVVAKRGGTVVYATLCVGGGDGGGDFLPLSVEYAERYSATGRTSGAYNKRDGRPGEKEILTSRLIDRPLRPSVADGWTNDLQLIVTVLASDGEYPADTLALVAASAALQLSRVSTTLDVGASRVAVVDGVPVADPTRAQLANATFECVVGASGDSVLMVEAEGDFVDDDVAADALVAAAARASDVGRDLAAWADDLRARGLAEPKDAGPVRPFPEALAAAVTAQFDHGIDASVAALRTGDMKAHRRRLDALDASIAAAFPDEPVGDRRRVLKHLSSAALADLVRADGLRSDGRPLDEVRPIDVRMRPLSSTHGSALFTRGETQSLATCTLGDKGMHLRVDDALRADAPEKRFYLQYTFPPSSVGETGRVGAPGRREVGHGALAEKALRRALPDEATFPYAVRVESLITESCGSSSMASVCGGTLALLDAGVPLARSVAGVAMGGLLADGVVFTDILGVEDALGGMDFKVAGDADGVSAIQVDVKTPGLTAALVRETLARAKTARRHVLREMATRGVAEPAAELAPSVPRFATIAIDPGFIGKVIGKGGATIKALIEDHGVTNIDVNESGAVTVSGVGAGVDAAVAAIAALCVDDGTERRGRKPPAAAYDGPLPEVSATYRGAVTSVKQFGAFVAIDDFPGLEGLCHISELAVDRVRNIENFIEVGDAVHVKVLSVDEKTKKLSLSRKAVLVDNERARDAA